MCLPHKKDNEKHCVEVVHFSHPLQITKTYYPPWSLLGINHEWPTNTS